jgi:glutamyl-tRNA reductase
MRLVAAGVSYRATPLPAREAAASAVEDSATLLRYLVGHAGVAGSALLSTCNRTEFYLTCPEAVAHEAAPRLAMYLDPSGRHELSHHLVARYDRDAARHLFRVAAGLESMVVGEAQVLGQVKDAHRAARDAGTLDARLDFVMRRAVSVGKRVRTQTRIGHRAGSLADAALDHAAQVLGDLRGRGVLLIGAGAMSAAAARRLRSAGSAVFVTSRSESAARLAAEVGGEAVALDGLHRVAGAIDVVVASTSSPGVVLDAPAVARLQRARGMRPLCILDIAVPRDVDPSAASVPGVTLADIDEVGARLEGGGAVREVAVQQAERIVAEEVEHTMRVLDERDAVTPTIAALLQRAEHVRRAELERTFARTPGLDEVSRERVDRMSRSLVRKLLHAPLAHLRDTADDPAVALTIREAFDLED